jgi:hypothetical protein
MGSALPIDGHGLPGAVGALLVAKKPQESLIHDGRRLQGMLRVLGGHYAAGDMA